MKKHLAIVAAAALAIGGTTRVWAADDTGTNAAGSNSQSESTIGKAADKADTAVRDTAAKVGIGSADQASANMSPHAAKIHDLLGKVAEDAVTKGDVPKIAKQFCKADRDRLDQDKDALKNGDELDGRIAEIQKDWKNKYNTDFNIVDQDKVYNMSFASINEMTAGEAARTASGTVAGENNSSAAQSSAAPAAGDKNVGDKEMARDMATVHIAASHGLPALDVPVVQESGSWYINIPDDVDAAKLKSNIQTALTDLDQKKDQWPADVNDGYRAVTHRVLLAIFDKPAINTGATSDNNAGSVTPAPAEK